MKQALFGLLILSGASYGAEPAAPQLPALELEQMPILDMGIDGPMLRSMTEQELEGTKAYLRERNADSAVTERTSPWKGDCYNNSGYWAGIYGPNVSGRPYDNDLYMVPPGYKTPDGWDCDGFYIPSDVTVSMTKLFGSSEAHGGPGAVKIRDFQWGVLNSTSRFERTVDATLLEWYTPSFGRWYIPGFPQQDLDDLGDTWRPKPPAGS